MGQGLGALLTPSRPARQRAAAAVPFAEIAACVADAIEHRLRCIPHSSQSDLFDGPVSARPTAADIAVASWVQRIHTDRLLPVVVISTVNDAVVYVDSRPQTAIAHQDAMRFVADGLIPPDLIRADRRDF